MNVGHWTPVSLKSDGLLLDPVGSNWPWGDWAYVRSQFAEYLKLYFDTLPNSEVT